jgi:hypothetical protein
MKARQVCQPVHFGSHSDRLWCEVRLEGPKGKRELPLEKFFVIPKSDGEREHDLRPNEIKLRR